MLGKGGGGGRLESLLRSLSTLNILNDTLCHELHEEKLLIMVQLSSHHTGWKNSQLFFYKYATQETTLVNYSQGREVEEHRQPE